MEDAFVAFASSSQLFVSRHLFNYKVRKMLAYFSADTDEAQVKPRLMIPSDPVGWVVTQAH